MSSGIYQTGFDDCLDTLDSMEITEQKQKKALKEAGKIILDNVIKNAPVLTGRMQKSIKMTVKRDDNGDLVCVIEVGAWYAIFSEYGTSYDKSNVGWFTRAVDEVSDKAVLKLREVLLS
jgi:HK97 gp10 family phage protein